MVRLPSARSLCTVNRYKWQDGEASALSAETLLSLFFCSVPPGAVWNDGCN
jgi:hypothetical protein